MNKIENVNTEWLTRPTGDPFADLGGNVIKELSRRLPDKNIRELLEYITDRYVNSWDSKLHAFFLNSKITHNSIKVNSEKIEKTMEYFDSIIDNKAPHELGYCRISGQKTNLFQSGRESSMLTGSGTFINFHHFFQKGIMLSKEVLFRLYFVPFGVMLLQGKVALIHSNNNEINQFFATENYKKNNLKDSASVEDKGVYKSLHKNPANAVFSFIDELLSNLKNKGSITDAFLTLYHFTNFGASPELQMYRVPDTVFQFYDFCLNGRFKEDWNAFVRSHYYSSKNKEAVYNKENECIELKKKDSFVQYKYDEYKIWTNWIYNDLLNGKSLLKSFLKYSKEHKLKIRIVEVYQIGIRNMKEQTIEKIKELASFIVNNQEKDDIGKSVKKLNGIKNSGLLRRFILKEIIVKNYNCKNEKPIVTLEDYVEYLFPDGSSWMEIRDILLITIYQNLHEKGIDIGAVVTEESEEEKNN
ncbi:MAG: hypothetical protein ACEPOV_14890 [Hyphomicrobiales bacterium]